MQRIAYTTWWMTWEVLVSGSGKSVTTLRLEGQSEGWYCRSPGAMITNSSWSHSRPFSRGWSLAAAVREPPKGRRFRDKQPGRSLQSSPVLLIGWAQLEPKWQGGLSGKPVCSGQLPETQGRAGEGERWVWKRMGARPIQQHVQSIIDQRTLLRFSTRRAPVSHVCKYNSAVTSVLRLNWNHNLSQSWARNILMD